MCAHHLYFCSQYLLQDKEGQLAKLKAGFEKVVEDMAGSAEVSSNVFFPRVESLTFTQMASKLEQAHKVALDSQRAEQVTEIKKIKAELTSGKDEKFSLLSERYESLVTQLDSTREAHATEISRMDGELKGVEESVAELL